MDHDSNKVMAAIGPTTQQTTKFNISLVNVAKRGSRKTSYFIENKCTKWFLLSPNICQNPNRLWRDVVHHRFVSIEIWDYTSGRHSIIFQTCKANNLSLKIFWWQIAFIWTIHIFLYLHHDTIGISVHLPSTNCLVWTSPCIFVPYCCWCFCAWPWNGFHRNLCHLLFHITAAGSFQPLDKCGRNHSSKHTVKPSSCSGPPCSNFKLVGSILYLLNFLGLKLEILGSRGAMWYYWRGRPALLSTHLLSRSCC
jgi:hypothetical protein